jgi:hypothetical protein
VASAESIGIDGVVSSDRWGSSRYTRRGGLWAASFFINTFYMEVFMSKPKSKNPRIIKRVYMIPFYDMETKKLHWLKLKSDNYKDALVIAGCIFQNPKEKVFFKDFVIVD